MQSWTDALQAEQHHAEETGLEEERGQHLIGHQRPDHRAGLVGEGRPVGAELVGHHDARHHAHAEGDGKDLQPVIEQVDVDLAPGPKPQRFEHRQIAREPDREGREYDVERHRESELRPGQYDRIPAFEHRHHPSQVSPGAISFENGITVFENCVRTRRLPYHAPMRIVPAPCAEQACKPIRHPIDSILSRLVISACTARVWSLPTSTGLRIFLPECSRIAIA